MTFIQKIDILMKKGIDFLGYDETYKIINKIIDNPKLQKEMLEAPDSFWEDAKDGILVYSDYVETMNSEKEPDERIITKYQDTLQKKHIPALVYEKQIKKLKIR